ncbi:putative gustatory receptor 58b [Drosophila santomea]|uniref:putative gustatory receptor 58b n=1 Tax=Drosophila santomea TaxID=129105 RepID=UPI001953CCA4|nr:putative gustatory receptor 58b [Drosophila santomea]
MLHPKLGRVLNVVYCHAVVFGLVSTTLRIRSHRKCIRLEKLSRTYTFYSFFVGIFLFLNLYYVVPRIVQDSYMKSSIVLQWSFFAMLLLRVVAIVGCYGTLWLERHQIIRLYKNSLTYWKRFGHIMKALVDRKELLDLQASLARIMVRKIALLYAAFLCSTVLQYQLLSVINKQSLLALSARLTHFLHLLSVKMAFYGILVLLHHQFLVIHLAINALHGRKAQKKWKSLRSVASMHLQTLRLARRIFGLYDVINATMFINIFMSAINILYHAVQYSNSTIKSDGWGILFGNGLIVFNFWGTLMLMEMLDNVLTSCNNTGQQLRQFSDLPKVGSRMQKELDVFAMQLRRNRLFYKIGGIVELDKPACLSYIGSILSNVVILMQFDLRRQRIPNNDHQYFTHFFNKTEM